MRHVPLGRSLLWFVCCTGLTSPVWAQAPILEPAPVGPPTPGSAPAPEPGSALAALLGPAPTAAVVATPDGVRAVALEEGPVRSGFAIGASLGVNTVLAGMSTGSPGNPQANVQPGFAIGGKVDRLVFTLGAEFTNLSLGTKIVDRSGAMTTLNQSNSTFLVVPGVQIGLVRSRDGRVELLGAVRFGFGKPTSDSSQSPAVTTPASTFSTSQFSFMYEVGPGVRYWAHRHFAVSLLGGFRGDYLFQNTSGNFPKDTSVTTVTATNNGGLNGIFASLGGLGVF